MKFRRICVYCGSRPGARPEYRAAARELGHALVERGIELVYGGGGTGLMGEVADAVLAAGGHVIGVIPHHLATAEVIHGRVREMHRVDTMHQRKQQMITLSDGFIALPGGFGTAEELLEALTWSQLALHSWPVAALNVKGYFDHLAAFLDHAAGEGFLTLDNRARLVMDGDVNRLLGAMAAIRAGAAGDPAAPM